MSSKVISFAKASLTREVRRNRNTDDTLLRIYGQVLDEKTRTLKAEGRLRNEPSSYMAMDKSARAENFLNYVKAEHPQEFEQVKKDVKTMLNREMLRLNRGHALKV